MEKPDVTEMSACAQAYVAEYGIPEDRADQDRYAAFRLGWEAGGRHSEQALRERVAWTLMHP